jgi:hypothetical protein
MSQPTANTVPASASGSNLVRTNTVKAPTPVTQQPQAASESEFKYPLPSETTYKHASKIAITEDRPIMMDYWTASCDKTAFIGVRASNKEKLLVKSAEEYTSPIAKILQVQNEYIILTENSIYLVSKDLPQKRIS